MEAREGVTNKTLTQITGNLFADLLAVFGIPAITGTELFRRFLKTKADEALAFLLEELRAGEIDSLQVANENEAIAINYRYALAVRDGAARRNFRLLARTMVGLAKRDRLYSDEFNRYADVLSRLTRDQILVLGRFHALCKLEERETEDQEHARSNAWGRMVDELVPSDFPSREHVIYVCSQATGLGLMVAVGAYGGLVYKLSPLMVEVVQLADFEDVLRSEGELRREG